MICWAPVASVPAVAGADRDADEEAEAERRRAQRRRPAAVGDDQRGAAQGVLDGRAVQQAPHCAGGAGCAVGAGCAACAGAVAGVVPPACTGSISSLPHCQQKTEPCA